MCKLNQVIFFYFGWLDRRNSSVEVDVAQPKPGNSRIDIMQGSYDYGVINITRTLIIKNDKHGYRLNL